jgi:hypothetical protein
MLELTASRLVFTAGGDNGTVAAAAAGATAAAATAAPAFIPDAAAAWLSVDAGAVLGRIGDAGTGCACVSPLAGVPGATVGGFFPAVAEAAAEPTLLVDDDLALLFELVKFNASNGSFLTSGSCTFAGRKLRCSPVLTSTTYRTLTASYDRITPFFPLCCGLFIKPTTSTSVPTESVTKGATGVSFTAGSVSIGLLPRPSDGVGDIRGAVVSTGWGSFASMKSIRSRAADEPPSDVTEASIGTDSDPVDATADSGSEAGGAGIGSTLLSNTEGAGVGAVAAAGTAADSDCMASICSAVAGSGSKKSSKSLAESARLFVSEPPCSEYGGDDVWLRGAAGAVPSCCIAKPDTSASVPMLVGDSDAVEADAYDAFDVVDGDDLIGPRIPESKFIPPPPVGRDGDVCPSGTAPSPGPGGGVWSDTGASVKFPVLPL